MRFPQRHEASCSQWLRPGRFCGHSGAMKVKRNTPEILVVGATPWLTGLAMIGFILIFAGVSISLLLEGELIGLGFLIGVIVGIGGFAAFVRRTQVVFNRPEGWVEIRSKTVLGMKVIRHDLSEISQAIVESSHSDGTTTYRVSLIIPSGQSTGTHPLSPIYSNTADHHGVAEAINHWLSETRRNGIAS